MAIKQGFRTTDNNIYVYQENTDTDSVSASMGIDSGGDPSWTINLSNTAGASPGIGFQPIGVNVVTGDITFTPNGAGNVIIDGGIKFITGSLAGSGVVQTTNTGALFSSGGTDGQILISDTATHTPLWANITAGAGITVTNGANTITIAAAGMGFSWNTVAGTSASMSVQNGYIPNNAGVVTLTLPAVAAVGDSVTVTGKGAGGWHIAQNAGQTIFFGASTTTTGVTGSLASTNRRDTIELVCVTTNNDWNVITSVGNITVA